MTSSRGSRLTDFKLKYDNFVYFSHWRSQFKLDLNQTLYDEWKQVSDEPYCLVSRSSDHIGSGWLVLELKAWSLPLKNGIFALETSQPEPMWSLDRDTKQ